MKKATSWWTEFNSVAYVDGFTALAQEKEDERQS